MGALDLAFAEAESVAVDTAGLVLLWPFLDRFFERHELMTGGRFHDLEARQRAVGLMHYAATGEVEPAEWRVVMARVLCGLAVDAVFDFGPPVSPAESDECEALLQAALAHAPILGEMSAPGMRATFLLRPGTLMARDGAWLLRVERRTYDVVLERLPWTFTWVRRPWMEAPLRVDWR